MSSRAAVTPGRDPGLDQRIHLIQGDFHVSNQPDLVLTTTLGSCVACCLFEPVAGVGGMNHFLLPGGDAASGGDARRYGAHAMELLINGMMRAGARKNRLEAKLFGGGRLSGNLPDIGGANAAFAEQFLHDEGIAWLGGSTGGSGARRIQFWPATGRVRQRAIHTAERDVFQSELAIIPIDADAGVVELFGD